MSNALNQARRANIRESSGNGTIGNSGSGPDGGGVAEHGYCIDLNPTPDEIRNELRSHAIMKVVDKITLAQEILSHKDIIASKLTSFGSPELAASFKNNLPADIKGDRRKNSYLVVVLLPALEEILRPLVKNPAALKYCFQHHIKCQPPICSYDQLYCESLDPQQSRRRVSIRRQLEAYRLHHALFVVDGSQERYQRGNAAVQSRRHQCCEAYRYGSSD